MGKEFEDLATNNSDASYEILDKALKQMRAYLALNPINMNKGQLRVLAETGKDIGKVAEALEEKVKAIEYAGLIEE